jgi:hypothetical protein
MEIKALNFHQEQLLFGLIASAAVAASVVLSNRVPFARASLALSALAFSAFACTRRFRVDHPPDRLLAEKMAISLLAFQTDRNPPRRTHSAPPENRRASDVTSLTSLSPDDATSTN